MDARRRNDIDICADMLRVADGGARKTHIVHGANLNFKIVNRYLDRLVGNGLLVFKDPYYVVTERGNRFVRRYEELMLVQSGSLLEEQCRTGS